MKLLKRILLSKSFRYRVFVYGLLIGICVCLQIEHLNLKEAQTTQARVYAKKVTHKINTIYEVVSELEWLPAMTETSVAPSDEVVGIEVCSYSPNKPYMDYRMITDTSSIQYQYIQTHMSVSEKGLLISEDDYIGVALGSVYGAIGTKYTVTTDTGNTFKIVKIDEKSDQHTTNGCYDQSGAIIEMVVDTDLMDSNVKYHGDYNVVSEFEGVIIKITQEEMNEKN